MFIIDFLQDQVYQKVSVDILRKTLKLINKYYLYCFLKFVQLLVLIKVNSFLNILNTVKIKESIPNSLKEEYGSISASSKRIYC